MGGRWRGSFAAAPCAESLLRCDGMAAFRTRYSDWPAQREVQKKSEQIRSHGGDHRPENGRHGTTPSVCVDVSEAENPDRGKRAGEQSGAHCSHPAEHRPSNTLRRCVRQADGDPDEHSTADDGAGCNACLLRHNRQKAMSFHRTLPFAFAGRAESRSTSGRRREKHKEGRTHKARTPACASAGSR